ncbi:MAG: hypothetical protein IKI57_04295 [Clostridia bacterium]|nr:hypothetical protein [Clostridia bacterium]
MKLIKSMSIYSICHFLVDFVSCIFVLGVAPTFCFDENGEFMQHIYIAEVIMYNFFAFAFQVPMGFVMDKLKLYKYVGIIGFCLIGICYAIGFGNAIVLASIVGIGNGLFHLEGGVNAYNNSKGKAFLNGLFVAPGAMGIFLGTMFWQALVPTFIPIILIVVAIILLAFVQKDELPYLEKEQNEIKEGKILFKLHDIISIALLIGVSIIVRSIGGSAIVYDWKTGFVIGLIYTILVVLGKAFGGFIGDRIGLKKTALFALLFACISLIIGFKVPFFGYLGIFLFNIPMSITLLILEKCNLKYIATMVGLNTLFLFIGYLICMIPNTMNNFAVLIVSIILAIISIFFAFKKYEKGEM